LTNLAVMDEKKSYKNWHSIQYKNYFFAKNLKFYQRIS